MNKLFFAPRKIFFWFHLVIGIASGIFILLMTVTGILLAFERQITDAADGYRLTAAPGGETLGVEELLASLQKAQPEKAPTGLTLRRDPEAPAAFQFGRDEFVFMDPRTGAVLGEGGVKTRAFFAFVNGLHRSLAMPGGSKGLGQAITAASSLAFAFIIVSGLYLWVPRRWTRRGVRAVTIFQPGLKGRARDWNWHHVLGIWLALPLLIEAGTGTLMSYHWGSRLLGRLAGGQPAAQTGQARENHHLDGGHEHGGGRQAPPKRDGRRGIHRGGQEAAAWPVSTAGWNPALAAVQAAVTGWQTTDFDLSPRGAEMVCHVSTGPRSRPDLSHTVTVDLAGARVVKIERFENEPLERRIHSLLEVIHTGGIAGWPGQLLAAVAAVAGVMLVWTGGALSWRRFRKKLVFGTAA